MLTQPPCQLSWTTGWRKPIPLLRTIRSQQGQNSKSTRKTIKNNYISIYRPWVWILILAYLSSTTEVTLERRLWSKLPENWRGRSYLSINWRFESSRLQIKLSSVNCHFMSSWFLMPLPEESNYVGGTSFKKPEIRLSTSLIK